MKARLAALAAGLILAATAAHSQVVINEGFDDITSLTASGWILSNASTPAGSTGWFQGDQTIFTSQAGAPEAYIGANYNNAAPGGTIANWLISPKFSTEDKGSVSFYARADLIAGADFADTLKFGFSSGGSSFADFALGAAQTIAGAWTHYTVNFAPQGAGTVGRFAIEYAGLADTSNYVGIDTFTVAVPEPETWALFVVGLGGLGVVLRRRKARRWSIGRQT